MFSRIAGGGGVNGGGGGGGGVGGGIKLLVRYFSKKRAENVRKTNPKVPIPEASAISMNLYQVIKQHGPLTIPNTWTQAQEAGVSGLQSKTHMKIMLKWMRGRKMLKLICNQVGSNKKFFVSTLPDEPDSGKPDDDALALQTKKPGMKKKKQIKQGKVKKQIKPGMLGKHRQY